MPARHHLGRARAGRLAPLLVLAVACAGALLAPSRARANGAFPDAQNLLTPAAWPDDFILATTFGVVFSRDGGRSWLWTCEQDSNQFGLMYQMGPGPRHRIFALANKTVVFSDDMTCSWRVAGGAVTGAEVTDVWVDRVVPERLFAVGARRAGQDGGADPPVYAVYPSTDGGQSFAPAVYTGAPGEVVTGVETAASDPRLVYLTVEGPGRVPLVLRSADGGATWDRRDLSATLGAGNLRLVDVDPGNPERVFLMWRDILHGEQLALSEDGGRTATVCFPGVGDGRTFTTFVRTPSGALLLATDTNTTGGLFRSTDRGQTWAAVANPPSVRGFSVRGGLLYAGTDQFADGYAIAASADDGDTWSPVMRYDQVQAVPACARAACRQSCELLTPVLWTTEVCDAEVPAPAAVDGGAASDAARDVSDEDAGPDGPAAASDGGAAAPDGGAADGPDARPVARPGGGACACEMARRGTVADWPAALLAAGVAGWLLRRTDRGRSS